MERSHNEELQVNCSAREISISDITAQNDAAAQEEHKHEYRLLRTPYYITLCAPEMRNPATVFITVLSLPFPKIWSNDYVPPAGEV